MRRLAGLALIASACAGSCSGSDAPMRGGAHGMSGGTRAAEPRPAAPVPQPLAGEPVEAGRADASACAKIARDGVAPAGDARLARDAAGAVRELDAGLALAAGGDHAGALD